MESSVDLRMFVFLILISPIWATKDEHHSFPNNFLFGTASSAYQFEGAYLSDGKGLNNWDVYTNTSGNIIDGSNGNVAIDHYHRYMEDTELMQSLGVNSHRFSISWARILPRGRHGGVNLPGINFYNNLIDSLLDKGIKPFVTLSHYDLPQELEDRYGSWLHKDIQEDFAYYADVCFGAFGDRVQYWATFNEPNIIAMQGYRTGLYPPSRCSKPFGNCTYGDSEKEPFIVAHNIILSHMKAVKIYRTKYQKKQGGSIGFIVNAIWFEPISNSIADRLAAKRALSFLVNWFLDPIIFGKYPVEMQEILGSTLPTFSRNHQMDLQNGLDFIGINHYTTLYVKDCMFSSCGNGMGCSRTEGFACQTGQKNKVPIGEPTVMEWYYVTPQGMEDMVMYLKERYNNKPIFVTENGYPDENWANATIKDFLYDINRVNYMRSYLDSLATAISKGADVRGYFAWALLDNFEWISGYTKRFGLHHVDFKTMKRTPKLSATWYKQYIANHSTIKGTTHERNQEYLQSY
ncbi:Beta-glucosidase 47 [Acorus gramineus]|uniref:Beta-glucosidase 47 n=1 Tax=Acorus gramineus TaxID=55184 RepID=A0AAV9BUI5_ACOGR|nr:Beta-glucosidase 47 [Acorus gramineus]